jgi:hypothetical protein
MNHAASVSFNGHPENDLGSNGWCAGLGLPLLNPHKQQTAIEANKTFRMEISWTIGISGRATSPLLVVAREILGRLTLPEDECKQYSVAIIEFGGNF